MKNDPGLHLVLSVPTGFHARELLMPLKKLLESDPAIAHVSCITPGAAARPEIFPKYGSKFSFYLNPEDAVGHEKLLQKLAPDIVVTTTFGLDQRDVPILRAGKALRIPTFTFVASWDNVYKMERFKRFEKDYVLADHLAVWNPMMREHLLRVFTELAADRVTVTGAPRFDFFHHSQDIPSREELLAYLGLANDGSKLIHIATTELYPMEYIVREIREAASSGELPAQLHLHASVHPGGAMENHRGYAQKYGVSVRFSFGRRTKAPIPEFAYNPTREEIYWLVALFKYSDVLVNHSSTVAIESMVADIPVVNVKYGRAFDWWRWYRSMVYRDFQQHYADITRGGGTTIAGNRRQLIAALARYLQDPSYHRQQRRETAQALLTNLEGTASQAMLDLIREKALNHRS